MNAVKFSFFFLMDCYRCEDYIWYYGNECCEECEECDDCEACKYCFNCVYNDALKYCKNCFCCEDCNHCEDCHECKNCNDCKKCYYCEGLSEKVGYVSNVKIDEKLAPVQSQLILSRGTGRLDHLTSLLAVVKKEVQFILENI